MPKPTAQQEPDVFEGEIIDGEVTSKTYQKPGRGSFGEAMGRAVRRGASSNVYVPGRDHFLYKAASKSIGAPLSELFSMIRGLKRNVENFTFEQTDELFMDVPFEILDRWIKNAQQSFVIFSCFVLIGAAITAWGTTRAGFSSLSTIIGGLLVIVYAISMGLRAARDVEIFRTRQPLPFARFVDQIEDLWCPLPVGHRWRKPIQLIVLPMSCLVFAGALVYAIVT